MLARITAFSLLSLAAVVSAGNIVARTDGTTQCNPGSPSCCASTETVTSDFLANLFGTVLGDLVGFGCSPIVGEGANCDQQPVCCTGVGYNGLVNIGCNSISL